MLRFRLRTLLIAVAIAAVPMAWVGYQLNWIRGRNRLRAMPHVSVEKNWPTISAPYTRRPSWALRVLGETGASVVILSDGSDVDVDEIRTIYPEATIWDGRNGRMTEYHPAPEAIEVVYE